MLSLRKRCVSSWHSTLLNHSLLNHRRSQDSFRLFDERCFGLACTTVELSYNANIMNAIDLFCGVGGMSLGFERAGFDVLAAFDFEHRHVEAYNYNRCKETACVADIQHLSPSEILARCSGAKEIDVIFGGPPCQGFSVAGKGLLEDSRNSLLQQFARVVSEIQPKVFVAENVTGILSSKYSELVAKFQDQMIEAGYTILDSPWVLDASHFGVPQRRRRVFFVGVLNGMKLPSQPEQPISWGNPKIYTTVEDAIGDLPRIGAINYLFESDRYLDELGTPSIYASKLREVCEFIEELPRHRGNLAGLGGCARTQHSEETIKRFHATQPGTSESISRFYRLDWKGQSPTLRAGTPSSHGQHMAARPIHPEEPRCITVREAARLHSFPDWFEFYHTKWYGFMQIGNSVPPYLAEAVASKISEALED